MSSSVISKLFWIFAFLCFLLIIQSGDDTTFGNDSSFTVLSIENDDTYLNYPLFFAAYQKVNAEDDDTKKLEAITEALNVARNEGYNDKPVLQKLYITAGSIHESRWHMVYAIENYKAAQSIIYDKMIDIQLTGLRKYLSQLEVERSLNDDYIATKYSGPAKIFRGKILVAYVFVDEGIKTRWSNKTKLRTQQVMSLVQKWQQEKAQEYHINDIEFINKTFIARKNPSFKGVKSVSFKSSHKDIQQFVVSVAQSLGEKSLGDFIEKEMQKVGAEQGVVFLHTNLDQRSFAHRCGYTHSQKVYKNGKYQTKMISQCRDEYVMLMEKVKRNRWDKMHYAQAHEMMHVFGASDLYNIKNASNYAVTDIMNFQSKNLVNSSVEPITAYAIGWQERPPKAPFKVLER